GQVTNGEASDFDCSFKHKLRRTRERDVAEAFLNFLETDLKFVTALRKHPDRAGAFLAGGKDERAGYYSRSAGEGFVFHAAFVGADGDFVRFPLFDEVHV